MRLIETIEGIRKGNYRVIGENISDGDYFIILDTKYESIARLVEGVRNFTSKFFRLRRKTAEYVYYTINEVGFFVGDEEE